MDDQGQREFVKPVVSPRILIVEDNAAGAEEILAALSRQGYDLVVAGSANEALQCLAMSSYDCVLVDTGNEEISRPVLNELRSYPTETVAFIIIGSDPDVSAIQALREGAFDYLPWPIDTDLLKASVARAIERASLSRSMRELLEDFDAANRNLRAFAAELQQKVDRMTVQLRHKLAELNEANRQLAQERRRREEFIAMVAHDLGGPLTTVDGYLQFLARSDLAPEVRERAHTAIATQTRQMARLLRDLTCKTPPNGGHFEVQPGQCDVAEIIREQVELARLRTERHTIRLELLTQGRVLATCDRDRLAQVLSNVLGNAIKYSPGGEITVRFWVVGGKAHLEVQDQGPGIPPDLLRSIFEPRVRATAGGTAAAGKPDGTGLGLHIARGIVEAMGGRIWAESDGAHGATFHIALPVD